MTSITKYVHSWLTGHPVRSVQQGRCAQKMTLMKQSNNFHKVIGGKVIFSDDKMPAADIKLNVFIKSWGIPYFVGSAKTDENGEFKLLYNWKKGWFENKHQVILGVVEKRQPFANLGANILKRNELNLQRVVKTFDANENDNDAGIIEVNYAQQSKDITQISKPPSTHMQSYTYYWKLVKAASSELPKKIFVTLFSPFLTTQNVQKIYDSFGPKYAVSALRPENLIDELLHEIYGTGFEIEGDKIVWKATWDQYTLDKKEALPNVKVVGRNEGDEIKLESIEIQFPNEDPETITFDDSTDADKSEWAIYLARSTLGIKWEGEVHLAEGHILPGIIAKSFFKYITKNNPIYEAVAPHLRELDFINWLGSMGIIFGKGSVLDASSLNESDIAKLILSSVINKIDWKSYSPPEPQIDDDTHAIAETAHFEMLKKRYAEIINENKDIWTKYWIEIWRWSESIKSKVEAFPNLTDKTENPDAEDLDNLAKFLAWLVSKTTFIHWAAHSRQRLFTHIQDLSLAIENKALNKMGILDPYGNTLPTNANIQLFIARTLLNFEGDSLLKNTNKDIDSGIISAVQQLKNEGLYRGYADIDNMFRTTNI